MKKVLTLAISLIAVLGLAFTLNAKVNAVSDKYDYTFTSKVFSTCPDSKDLGGISWSISGTSSTYYGRDETKGQQFGSSGSPMKELVLSSSSSFEGITEVRINTSGASKIKASFSVLIGDTIVGTESLTNSAIDYTFPVENLTGVVSFSFTQTSSKALYIKSIGVTYSLGDVESHNVVLMDGDNTISTLEVVDGDNLDGKLSNPTKEGYVFDGWYKDAELTIAWDSSVDTVTADTTLYAKWNEVNYTKITSLDELVSAQYYIAPKNLEVYVNGLESNWLTLGDISQAIPVTIKNEGDYYSVSYIKNDTKYYLGHNVNSSKDHNVYESSTIDSDNYKYTISYVNGGWNLTFSDGQSLAYSNQFSRIRVYNIDDDKYLSLDLYKINGTEIEETPVVATKFMESETNASLRLFYDAETLVASDVDLRFGVTLSADAYVEGAKYGVIAMPASLGEITSGIQDYTSVEEYLAANPNCTAIAATNIAKVNESGEADEAGSYYQFAWVINNMEGHYSDGIVAVCYMEYEGKLYFNVVKEESVLTVVDKYLALTGLSEEVLTVLENLKNNQ